MSSHLHTSGMQIHTAHQHHQTHNHDNHYLFCTENNNEPSQKNGSKNFFFFNFDPLDVLEKNPLRRKMVFERKWTK